MPLVRILRERGATITVEANGELLFVPTGPVARWNRSLSAKVRGAAARHAPTNKRPRWVHYGKPLKSTMRASTEADPATMRVHSVVGSTAPHGYYVDQGTGIYNGGSPYPAKILPPWTQGGSTLYEHTWRPGGGQGYPRRVLIKGQRPQRFLDAGLRDGLRAMRVAPGVAPSGAIAAAISTIPRGLENFFGNTPVDAPFLAQLTQWRAWRDEAWQAKREAQSRAAQERYDARRRKQAETQAAILAEVEAAEKERNLAAYRASKEAAARRAAAQAAELKAQREARAEAERIKAENSAKARAADRLQRGNRKMRQDALAFYNQIKAAYPNATLRSTTIDGGVIVYRVRYTLGDGEVVKRDFAYGYSDD